MILLPALTPTTLISLDFHGYYPEAQDEKDPDDRDFPPCPGIYCAYTCTEYREAGMISGLKLYYIGQAKNIRDRTQEHDREGDLWDEVPRGKQLYYAWAAVEEKDLDRVEAAMIFHFRPSRNRRSKDSFPHKSIRLKLSGAFIPPKGKEELDFTVQETQ